MKKWVHLRALLVGGGALILAITGAIAGPTANAGHTSAVNLGAAATFAILAGTPNITNVPTSTIVGNVGLSPATGAGIGLTCAEVTGTIYSVDAAGPLPCRVTDPGLLGLAKNALSTAIGDAAGRPGGLPVAANELAATTLTHGVYNSAAAMALSGGGTLTLDGGGDPNAVFIFQLGTDLTVSNSSRVDLIGQAQSCNVFWQVDRAFIGSAATFRGTILAATSITVGSGSTIDGRLLANTGSVTLISDTVTVPTCAAAPAPTAVPTCPPGPGPFVGCMPGAATATPTPTATPSPSPSPSPSRSPSPAPSATPVAAPTAGPTATPSTPVAAATPGIQRLPSTSTRDLDGAAMWAFVLACGALPLLVIAVRSRARRTDLKV